MKVGVPREVHPGERRVAATPETVLRLKKRTLVIAVAAPDAKFEDFRPLARQVLATVHLRQR